MSVHIKGIKIKTIIAGPRDFNNYEIVKLAISMAKKIEDIEVTEVVCGMARGVDLLGLKWAKENNIPVKEFPADWNKYGKSAGPIRNGQMANYSEALIAICYTKPSPGTKNMITQAKKKGLKTYIFWI